MGREDRRSGVRKWIAASVVVWGMAGCGGGGGGGGHGGSGGSGGATDGGTGGGNPNMVFACNGVVTEGDAGDAGEVLNLPSPGLPGVMPLDVCAPADAGASDLLAKCAAKCTNSLTSYATALTNSMPSDPVNASNLNCVIRNDNPLPNTCPDMDPPGVPEPPFSGGPAQYVASLTGDVHLNVAFDTGIPGIGTVNVGSDTTASGQIGYAILPSSLFCPPDGCQVLFTGFNLAVADFDIGLTILGQTFFDHQVTGMGLQNAGWITGMWQPDGGTFTIFPNTAQVAITANDNGVRSSTARFNDTPITGKLDPLGGTISFDPFSQSDGNVTTTISGLSGPDISFPPVAAIAAPPATVECNRPKAASVTLDGTASTPSSDIHIYSWTVNGGPVISGPRASAVLPLGTDTVVLNVFNSSLGVDVATETVTVVDTTPPVIAPPSTATAETCSDGSTTIVLTPPTVTDACNPSPTVTGSVISTSPPIPIVNGRVSLSPGTYTVRWTASDGVQTSTATQTVIVQPGILVKGQFTLDDRAKLQSVSGGSAGVGNAGAVTTKIGNDTSLGDIVSVAPVVLLDRAIVQGSVRSNGTITLGHSDNIAGSVVPNTSVTLPPVPDLTGVTFPSPSGGSPTFNPTNPPGGTVPLAPGSYGTVNINSGARVSLSAGSYYFQQLLINAASSTLVIGTTGVVRIFVASQLAYRGQVVTPAGQQAQIFLGYNGTNAAVLEAPFLGTFVAPRGGVSIGTSSTQLFRGRFFGQNLEVRPGIQIICDTSVTAQ